jgi:serine/threonine-protein kinase
MILTAGSTVGRYTVLGKLATGGMSAVYLARGSGPGGFAKVLVLKVIQPALADDPEFVQMFHNEARLAALLNHPNVVQVFDYGVEHDLHYMAMEYIDGQSLSRVVRAAERGGEHVSLPLALRLASEVGEALSYAHGLADPSGTPLHIVHRDVSLENILLTYAGQVKLVDFGLVKARTLESPTSKGMVKGKFAYIAPEVLDGRAADGRADIFALGVVLYRTILGRMPFPGEHYAEIFERILHDEPAAPRTLQPEIPEAVERVVLRALAKDPARRYQRARELLADLDLAMQAAGAVVTSRDLAEFMESLFPPQSDPLRASYQAVVGVARPYTGETLSPPASREDMALVFGDPALAPDRDEVHCAPTVPLRRPRAAGETPSSQPVVPPRPIRPWRLRGRWVALCLLLGAGAVAVWIGLGRARVGSARDDRARPPDARVVDVGRADAPRLRREARSAAMADAPAPRPDGSLPAALSVGALAPATVYLDGKVVGAVPLRNLAAAAGRRRLRLESQLHAYDLSLAIVLRPGEHLRLQLAPKRGTIRVLAHPFAVVTVDGKRVGTTPFAPLSVYEGMHQLVLENPQLGTRRNVRVRVQPGTEALVKVSLEQP